MTDLDSIPPYSTKDAWYCDEHRRPVGVHYRLYLSPHTHQATVICVQDFDYLDYDARRILYSEAWESEFAAELALVSLLPAFVAAQAAIPDVVDADLRDRLIARAVRGD